MGNPGYPKDYAYASIMARYGYYAKQIQSGMTADQIKQQLKLSPQYASLDDKQIDDFINRYDVVASSSDARFNVKSGLDALLLKDRVSGDLVISIAGVGPSSFFPDLPQTFLGTQMFGFNTDQFADLRKIVDTVRDENGPMLIDIIGHSLGGQLAEMLYADSKLHGYNDRIQRVITFGSYGVDTDPAYQESALGPLGVPDYKDLLRILDNDSSSQILNFLNEWDPVYLLGKTYHGTNVVLNDTGYGILYSHNINDYYKPLIDDRNNVSALPPPAPLKTIIGILPGSNGQGAGVVYAVDNGDGSRTTYWKDVTVTTGGNVRTGSVTVVTSGNQIVRATTSVDGVDSALSVDAGSDLEAQLLRSVDGAKAAAAPRIEVTGLNDLIMQDTEVTGGGATSSIAHDFLTARVDESGQLILQARATKLLSYDPRDNVARYAVEAGGDEYGRETTQEWEFDLDDHTYRYTGVTRTVDNKLIITRDDNGPTTIRLANSSIGVDFVDAGQVIGSTFGRYIAGGSVLTQTVASAAFQTIGSNFGDILNAAAFDSGKATASNISHAFDGMDKEFLGNLKSAGLGAVSAYLTAELVGAIGLHGVAGDVLNSAAGYAISHIVNNLASIAGGAHIGVFDGIGINGQAGANLAFAAGSFIGNELASAIVSWDTIGSQLGSSIGGTLGASVGQALIPVPVLGAAIGAFLGNLIGGLIGGIFGGVPRAGAIVGFDDATDKFAVESVWKKSGGSKTAARQLGETAANSLNDIVSFIGGEVLSGAAVDAGSYGLRKKNYVYWQDGTDSDNRLSFDKAQDLINYGVMRAAAGLQFLGGDVIAKRAFYNTMAQATTNTTGKVGDAIGLDALLGNFAVVGRLETYLASSTSINALIAAEPNSVMALDWMLALSRANELGLLKRNTHDWDGGFSYLLKRASTDARDVQFGFQPLDASGAGERVTMLGDKLLSDTIDSGSKTVISGGDDEDVLTAATGGTRTGAAQNDAYHIANIFYGGAGDDRISAGGSGDDLFGGDGNDRLVGGALDDWLFGGSGNDVLDAGGGSGNVLSGGSGDDQLMGADGVSADPMNSGSDWLSGGDGDDRLLGRGGDDYLEGGTGNDHLDGGEGSDTYVYRPGDGHDLIADSGITAGERDVLDFDRRITPGDVTVIARSSGTTLTLRIGKPDAGDLIDLRDAVVSQSGGIDAVSFTNAEWTRGDVAARAVFAKTAGANVQGTASNETLKGTDYDDRLTGGGGSDTLAGGYGSDVYTVLLNGGDVTIDDVGFAEDVDVLAFGTGITRDAVALTFGATPGDLVIHLTAYNQTITLKHQSLSGGDRSIEEVRFADGTSMTVRDLVQQYLPTLATEGSDTAKGFDGSDKLATGNGDDTLSGGGGDDNLEGGFGVDTYVYNIGDGNDRIYDASMIAYGATAYNTLQLGAGISASDLLLHRDAADGRNLLITFRNTTGSILVDDYFTTSSWGYDSALNGINSIKFADGTIWDRATIDAHSIEQSISAKNDFVNADKITATISTGAGNDVVRAGSGDDVITGGVGNDDLEGGFGADKYVYNVGDGDDRIFDNSMIPYGAVAYNTLQLGVGITASDLVLTRDAADTKNLLVTFRNTSGSILIDDQLSTYSWGYDSALNGITTIKFADGTVWDRATLDAHFMSQQVSGINDYVNGDTVTATIDASSGNDVIRAGSGDDVIIGGTGNDDLEGGFGADTYVYNIGDGFDRIFDNSMIPYGATAYNTLQLGAGIVASDLVLERDTADSRNLSITFRNQSGSILIDDQFTTYSWGYDSALNGITTIRFADGSTWDRAAIDAHFIAQSISGGNDYVDADTITAAIRTGAGDDVVRASSGDDVIEGGLGDDDLEGGFGVDTYVYNVGDGNDRISDRSMIPYGATAYNALQLGTGITAADLLLHRDGADSNNLLITFKNAAGSILVDDQFTSYSWGYDSALNGINSIKFADGTTWDRATMDAAVLSTTSFVAKSAGGPLNGDAGDNILTGSGKDDVLAGGAGVDRLEGGDGNDTYLFNRGDGHDAISDASGSNVVRFGAGITASDVMLSRSLQDGDAGGVVLSIQGTDDRLYIIGQLDGRNRIAGFEFADGTTWTAAELRTRLYASEQTSGSDIIQGSFAPDQLSGGAGNDRIYGGGGDDVLSGGTGGDRLDGGSGNDTLAGGGGADRLEGGDGNDTYLFNRGDGADAIIDTSGSNVVRLGAGIAASDVRLSRAFQDGDLGGVVLSIVGTEDRLYMTGQLDGPNRIGSVEFADGTKWTEADIRAHLFADEQTPGADVIQGSYASDQLSGAAGNDYLYGRGGDDTLAGGTGVDRLEGGSGNDTYLFNRGDERDAIWDEGGDDTLRFGAGISAGDLVLSRSLQDGDARGLVIAIANTEDRVYLIGAQGAGQAVEHIEFADGTRWTLAELRAHLYEQSTTAGADVIRGSDSQDNLYGGGGDDFLYGDDGNDILDGGSGADRLEGGGGDDTYLFGRIDGRDTIVDAGGIDVVRFAAGVQAGDLTVTRSMQDGDDAGIVLSIKGTEDRLYIVGQQNAGSRVESFVFADGTTWTWQTVTDLVQANTLGGVTVPSTMGDDTIGGTMAADVLRGMGGDDVLRGGMGSDRYLYARGDGNDVIFDAVDASAIDRLELTGINAADVRVVTSPTDSDDVIIEIADGQSIYLDQQNVAGGGIDEVVFADGTVWTKQQLADRAAGAFTSSSAEQIVGTNFAETLHGGIGNNVLAGLGGGDTYLYNLGDGADTIDEQIAGGSKLTAANTDLDILRFGAGIAFADLRLAAMGAGGDMMLTIAGRPGSLLLKGQDVGGANGIELLAFADGTTTAFSALRSAAIEATVSAGDDVVEGFASGDVLAGGRGNDMLVGGAGADTYVYARGDGIDTIVETADGATNVLMLGAGIVLADLRFARRANAPSDLFVTVAGGGEIVVRDHFGGTGGIQQVRLADGTALSRDDIVQRMLAEPATPGDDFVVGSGRGDTIDGLAGADTIFGMEGDDAISGGEGNDELRGGTGADTIRGGDGDDLISGDEGLDVLDGGAGYDTVDYGFSLDRWSIDLASGTATMIGVDAPQVEAISGFEAAIGGIGADVLTGDGGANTLRGGSGDDMLRGGGGDDVFLVDGDEDGVDTVDGGAGIDTILAMSDDTMIGLAGVQGVERISGGGHAGVMIAATDGDDTLDLSGVALEDIQSILMGDGNDVLTGSVGADVIDLGAGDDVLRYGTRLSAGDDVDGGEGNDRIEAAADGTVIHLSRMVGIETVTAAGFADVVVEGSDAVDVFDLTKTAYVGISRFELDGGDDTFVGGQGADVVRGGSGDDVLAGNAGDDVFEFGAGDNGHDRIDGGAGVDTVLATADGAVIGIAALSGVEAIDAAGHSGVTVSLTGAADALDLSNLTITGIEGIAGGAGDDVIRGSGGVDTFLVGVGDGSDDIDGGAGFDTVKATANGVAIGLKRLVNVEAISADGHVGVTVHTTEGADTFDVSGLTLTGIERIALGAGNDVFVGTGGNDTVEGGTGSDTLTGGYGDDTYLFSLGDGNDTIREGLNGAGGGFDVLRFGPGIRPEDVQVTTANNGADFVFSIGNGSDAVRVINGASASENYWIDEVRFDDGTVWARETLAGAVVPYTSGDDRIYGTNDAETLRAGAGNDWINGRGGDDTIIGGTGDDTLGGGSGDDTYVFNRGDGQDAIRDGIDYYDGGNGGNDTIVLGAGILAADVTVSQQGNGRDLKLDLGQGDSIYIGNSPLTDSGNVIERVRFADGTIWTAADLFARSIIATDGADTFRGTGEGETIAGGAGNDWINGRGGDDTIIGGTGDDTVGGGSGDDTYVFNRGDGQDTIRDGIDYYDGGNGGNDTIVLGAGILAADVTVSQQGNGRDLKLDLGQGDSIYIGNSPLTDSGNVIERVRFADGTIWTAADLFAHSIVATDGADTFRGTANGETIAGGAGNDWINGRGGDDTIIGGTGDDTLGGGSGDDTYVFNRGDGQDAIRDGIDYYDGGNGGNDTIVLGAGITPDQVTVSQEANGRDLKLDLGQGDSIYIGNSPITDTGNAIEQVRFADGTVWTATDLVTKSSPAETDVVWVRGDDGNNELYGSDFAETIVGGRGNDYLEGRSGSDTYVYRSGDGNDRIADSGNASNVDVLKLTDLNASQVQLRRSGNDLWVRDLTTLQEVKVDRQFQDDGTWGIDKIVFADGATLDRDTIRHGAVFYGDDGNNEIYGSGLDDTLQGGKGNDYLEGRGGGDAYVYASGDGSDRIADQGAAGDANVLKLTNLNASQVQLRRSGNDLWVRDLATLQEVKVDRQFQDDGTWGLNQIVFADGTTLDREAIRHGAVFYGDDGNNEIYGSGLDDTLQGGKGNDYLEGRGGGDAYVYASGDGSDRIADQGAAGDANVLKLTDLNASQVQLRRSGNDLWVRDLATLQEVKVDRQFQDDGTWGLNQIVFADGTRLDREAIRHGAVFYGDEGNNEIYGSGLDDTLQGGKGNDYLEGRGGGDAYVYASGDGGDRIADAGSVVDIDVLQLVDLNAAQVSLRRDGGTLYVKDTTTGIEIRVDNQFYSDATYGVEQIVFADGTAWDRTAIQQAAWFRGDANGNELYGSDLAETLIGNLGNDYLEGRRGSDTYIYASGDGSDRINEAGDAADVDVLKLVDLSAAQVSLRRDGGTLYVKDVATGAEIKVENQFYSDSTYGIEQIVFADGTSWDRTAIQQAAWFRGDAGYNELYGSNLAETLIGYGGNDYLEGRRGSDIYVYASGDGSDRINEAGDAADVDVLKLVDLTAAQVSLRRDGGTLYVKDVATGAEIKVENQFYSDSTYGIEQIVFADGTSWDRAAIQQAAWIRGDANGNELYGSDLAETLIGNLGNDYLEGRRGSDTYVYASGDGSDRVNEAGNASDVDVLKLVDLDATQIALRRDGGTMYAKDLTTGAEIKIENQFYSDATYGIEQIVFADGSSWDRAQIQRHLTTATDQADQISGNSDADYLRGLGGNDILSGLGGNDELLGDSGDDVLNGGAGDDLLIGGDGTDTAVYSGRLADYKLATVDGQLTITDFNSADGDDGTDRLVSVEQIQFNDGVVALAAPIVLDLDGDGVALVDRRVSNVTFDMDADGAADDTAWIDGRDAFLVIDRDGDGLVQDVSEISFIGDKSGATSDLDGLQAFDTNGDGLLSAGDASFSRFGAWQDRNSNGKVDEGEFAALSDVGIVSINLQGLAANDPASWTTGATLNVGGFTWADGAAGNFADVALAYQPTHQPAIGNTPSGRAAAQLIQAGAMFGAGTSGSQIDGLESADLPGAQFIAGARAFARADIAGSL